MKSIKQILFTFTFLIVISVFLTSCLTTKTNVGAYKETQGSEYTYAKGKQIWLFWGVLPIGRTKVATPTDGACQVIVKFNLIDFAISGITGGIIMTETIKIKAKHKE
jgi:hypothetical protein